MPLVPISDIHLQVCVEGSGPPLVLLHGFPLDHTMWRRQIDYFSATRTVIAPDLRGLGRSDGATGTSTMERFADDVAELLDELSVNEPACVAGLSMGGCVAFQVLRRHPHRVASLVLVDCRAARDAPDVYQKRYETADRVMREGTAFLADMMLDRLYAPITSRQQPALIAATREVITSSPRGGTAAAARGLAERPDVTDWLSEIRVPTLVIVGAHDIISPPDEMRGIAGKIPGARFVCLDDAGHMSPEEQPSRFNAELESFLQR